MATGEGIKEQARAGGIRPEQILAALSVGAISEADARELLALAIRGGQLVGGAPQAPGTGELPKDIDNEIDYLIGSAYAVMTNIDRGRRRVPSSWALGEGTVQSSIEQTIQETYPDYRAQTTGGVGQYGQPGGVSAIEGPMTGRAAFGGQVPPTYDPILPEHGDPRQGLMPSYVRGLREAGLPTGVGGGTFGRYLSGRYSPTYATYMGSLGAGRTPAVSENPFQEYVMAAGGRGLGSEATQAFQALRNMQRGGFVGTVPAEASRFIAPSEVEDYEMAAELAMEAARGRIGAGAAARLLPSEREITQEWFGGPRSAMSGEFLEFLAGKLGI